MGAPASLQLIHHHPGRIRVRADALRRDAECAARVRDGLRSASGVRRVLHDAFTGSILVEYEPGLVDPDALLRTALAAGGFDRLDDCAPRARDPREPVRRINGFAGALNDAVADLTGGRADLRSLVPAGLAAAGILSLLRRPVPARWDNLLVWSMQIFMSLNQDQLRGRSEPGAR